MASQNKSRKGLVRTLLAAAAVLVIAAVVIVVTAFWLPGWAPKHLDQTAVQNGVQKVVSENYQATDVKDVSCPSGQRIKKGATFTCNLSASGQPQVVTVKILDKDGKYEVSRPSPK